MSPVEQRSGEPAEPPFSKRVAASAPEPQRAPSAPRGWVLGPLARLLAAVLDSPVAEMDAREVLASWRVGLWLGGLLSVLALFAALAAWLIHAGSVREEIGSLGIGAFLAAAAELGIATFLTFAVPVRTAGLLEGPRWRGYFDQLVVSGVAPWRCFAGRALVAQAFVAVVLLASVPVVVAFALVDPPPLAHVLEVFAHLWAYAELLLAVSLGLSVLVHEVLAAIATILCAIFMGLLAWAPLPTAIVAASPVRAILAPFGASIDSSIGPEIYARAPCLLGVSIPDLPYSLALTFLLAGLALVSCFFGPLHSFAPGLNNFGAVVLPGDRKRAAIRRIRPFLTRRADVAFFFENQGPVHADLVPWARAAQIGALLLLAGAIPIASVINEPFLRATRWPGSDDVLATIGVTLSLWGVAATCLLATARSDGRVSLALGPVELPLVLVDLAVYAAVAAVLVVVTAIALLMIYPFLASPGFALLGLASATDLVLTGIEWAAVFATVGFLALLVQKLVGLRTWGRRPGIVVGMVGVLALQGIPFLLANPRDLEERTQKERDVVLSPEQNARVLARLHFSCVMRLMISTEPKPLDGIRLPDSGPWLWLAQKGFWVLYPTMEILLALAVTRLVVKRRREARAERAPPAGAPA